MRPLTGRQPVRVAALVLLLLAVLGCSGSVQHDGPRVAKRPDGFAFDPNASAARKVLPDRVVTGQRGYFTLTEPHNSIMITEYRGSTSGAQAEAARSAAAKKWSYQEYGPAEGLEIDGRDSWGWLITQRSKGEVTSLEYVVVVPYADRTYSVEFYASEDKFHDKYFLKKTVSSFEVPGSGPFEASHLFVLAGLTVAAFIVARRLRRFERRESARQLARRSE